MITLRRAEERRHELRGKQEVWLTFYPQDRSETLAEGFCTLEVLYEIRLPPGGGVLRRPRRDAEIVTFVRHGALAYEDSTGQSGLIQAGEFRRMTAGRGIGHRETNASRTDWAHVFQMWLRPTRPDLEPSQEQKRFSTADRRGRLCVIGSPDGRSESLRVHQDALVYSALLDPGRHVVHELPSGRSAWLHLVQGEVTLGDVVLTTGDGVGVRAERAVSLTAQETTEVLLLDLGESVDAPQTITPRDPKGSGSA